MEAEWCAIHWFDLMRYLPLLVVAEPFFFLRRKGGALIGALQAHVRGSRWKPGARSQDAAGDLGSVYLWCVSRFARVTALPI